MPSIISTFVVWIQGQPTFKESKDEQNYIDNRAVVLKVQCNLWTEASGSLGHLLKMQIWGPQP